MWIHLLRPCRAVYNVYFDPGVSPRAIHITALTGLRTLPAICKIYHTLRSRYILFTLHSSLFTLHSSLFTLHSSLFTLHSSLFTLHYIACLAFSSKYLFSVLIVTFCGGLRIDKIPYFCSSFTISFFSKANFSAMVLT